MISSAVNPTLQAGNEFPTKKLSESFGQKSEPSLMFGNSTYDAGSAIDCGIFSPSSAAIAALIVTATCAGPVPADEQCKPSAACCAHSLRKPFSVSPEIGIMGCFESS